MWCDLAEAFHELWRPFAGAFGSYRPELHYMRGPGPKCRAKRAAAASATAPELADTLRARA